MNRSFLDDSEGEGLKAEAPKSMQKQGCKEPKCKGLGGGVTAGVKSQVTGQRASGGEGR